MPSCRPSDRPTQVDERTQTNWNGIVGRMELRATDPVWIDDVQVYPDVSNKTARVRVVIGNITGKPAKGRITVSCESYNVANPATFKTQTLEVYRRRSTKTVVEFTYTAGVGSAVVGRVRARDDPAWI